MKKISCSPYSVLALAAVGLAGCGGSSAGDLGSPGNPAAITPPDQLSGLIGKKLSFSSPDRQGVQNRQALLVNMAPGDQNTILGLFQVQGGQKIGPGCSGSPILGPDGKVAFGLREGVADSIGVEPSMFRATEVAMTDSDATDFLAGNYGPSTPKLALQANPYPLNLYVRGNVERYKAWFKRGKVSSQFAIVPAQGSISSMRSPLRASPMIPQAGVSGRGYVGMLSSDSWFGATIIMAKPDNNRYLLATAHSIGGYGATDIPTFWADTVPLSDGSIDFTPIGNAFGTLVGDLRYGSVIDTQASAATTTVTLSINGQVTDSKWIAQLGSGPIDEYFANLEEMSVMVDNYFKSQLSLKGSATIHIVGVDTNSNTFDETNTVDTSVDGGDLNSLVQNMVNSMVFDEYSQLAGQDLVISTIELTVPAGP